MVTVVTQRTVQQLAAHVFAQVVCSNCGKNGLEVDFSGEQKEKGADAARYCRTCAATRQTAHLSGLNKKQKQQAFCQLALCRPCALTDGLPKNVQRPCSEM